MKKLLYKMLESNEGGSLSNARVASFICTITGIILLILHFFDIGVNPESAYVLIGIGTGTGITKSITSQPKMKEVINEEINLSKNK